MKAASLRARPFQITEYNPFDRSDRLDPSQILNAVFHNGVANSAGGTISCSAKEALVQLFATPIVQPTLRLGEVLLTRLPSPSLSSDLTVPFYLISNKRIYSEEPSFTVRC